MVFREAFYIKDCAFEGELVWRGGFFQDFCEEVPNGLNVDAVKKSVGGILLGVKAELAFRGVQDVHFV